MGRSHDQPQRVVIDLANSAPEGVSVLDSPVIGAVDGARNGTLTLFVGGDSSSYARVQPVISHLGQVIHCSELGLGNVVKPVTNQLWVVAAAAIGEGFALGLANGVELGTLWEAIKASVGDSFVAQHDAPPSVADLKQRNFTSPNGLRTMLNCPCASPATGPLHGRGEAAMRTYHSDLSDLVDLDTYPVRQPLSPDYASGGSARSGRSAYRWLRSSGAAAPPGCRAPYSSEIIARKHTTHYSTDRINPYFHITPNPEYPPIVTR